MFETFTYRAGAELPGLTLPWQEEIEHGEFGHLDLSAGYTFTLELIDKNGATALTKTTGITGADGSVVVAWAVGELDQEIGVYLLHLRARETATSKDRDYRPDEPLRLRIR